MHGADACPSRLDPQVSLPLEEVYRADADDRALVANALIGVGHDFGRLGFSFIDELKATGPDAIVQLDLLDVLVDYRNAIGHGNEAQIIELEVREGVKATKKSYLHHKRSGTCQGV